MEAKEKAKELVESFLYLRLPNELVKFPEGLRISQAKQCALICVDEIIEVLNVKQGGKIHNQMGFIDYWQEVKQEIEKL